MWHWLTLAADRRIVRRAGLCALMVGAVLVTINHGDAIWRGELTARRWLQMGLTMLVPYCVSTFSSVEALRSSGQTKP